MTRTVKTDRGKVAVRTTGRARFAEPLGEARHGAALDVDVVHNRIWNAIVDHSIPPGTRLIEAELCEIFGLGRTRLRAVLQRLARQRVITLVHKRSARVSHPTPEEAREVFAARRIVEAGIVSMLVCDTPPAQLRRLSEHVEREQFARHERDHRTMLTLAGEFHGLLAEAAGNGILVELLRDLISRSSLIIAVYQPPRSCPCSTDEHRDLIAMLERADPDAVCHIMKHLDDVFAELRLEDSYRGSVDLRSVFTMGGSQICAP